MSREQTLAALRRAHAAIGEPFMQKRYLDWRSSEIAANPRWKKELPGYAAIYNRLGGWRKACRALTG